jgi:hypothetical protein
MNLFCTVLLLAQLNLSMQQKFGLDYISGEERITDELIPAAAKGGNAEVKDLIAQGADIDAANALHVAVAKQE